jgi:hypothetical protein
MCNFMSAIVLRTTGGFDVLRNPWTDSHEDLVTLFKLRDTRDGSFARVEFTPKDGKSYDEPAAYVLTIDEGRKPDWLDEAMQEKVAKRMRGWVKSMIVDGDVDLLCGGVWILGKNANVGCVKGSVIKMMLGSSKVGEMWESSNVGEMWDSSNVGVMWGSSKVGVMWESSNVGVMRDSSNVGEMWESSNVGEMWGSSKVGEMRDSSNVGVMWGSSKVENDNRKAK